MTNLGLRLLDIISVRPISTGRSFSEGECSFTTWKRARNNRFFRGENNTKRNKCHPYARKYPQGAEDHLTNGSQQDAAHPSCESTNASRRVAVGVSHACLVGENPTCSVPAFQRCEGLWSDRQSTTTCVTMTAPPPFCSLHKSGKAGPYKIVMICVIYALQGRQIPGAHDVNTHYLCISRQIDPWCI